MPKKITINQAKYDNNNTVKYSLKLNIKTDKKIIDLIENTAIEKKLSKQGAIKYLINKNIEKIRRIKNV